MKFIVDECTGPSVADFLTNLGHDVFSVFNDARGLPDEKILEISRNEQRIIITNDKDFGKLIFHNKEKHSGVIFLRLEDERKENKIFKLKQLLMNIKGDLYNKFIVVTEKSIRISNI